MKYLGIVDGSMGILSRKMKMQNLEPLNKKVSAFDGGVLPVKTQQKIAKSLQRSKMRQFNAPILQEKYQQYCRPATTSYTMALMAPPNANSQSHSALHGESLHMRQGASPTAAQQFESNFMIT